MNGDNKKLPFQGVSYFNLYNKISSKDVSEIEKMWFQG